MGFPSAVHQYPAPAIEGDFASANPRASALAGDSTLIAGDSGAIIGRFGWIDQSTGKVNNTGTGAPDGYIHREMQATITQWLGENGMTIQKGQNMTMMKAGDFWAKSTVAAASAGQKAFASTTDGTMQPGAAGATIAGFVETNFYIRSAGAIGELVKISTY